MKELLNNKTQFNVYRKQIKKNKIEPININLCRMKYGNFKVLKDGMFLIKTDGKGIKYLFINKYIYEELGNPDDLPDYDVCFVIKIESFIVKNQDLIKCNKIIDEYNKK